VFADVANPEDMNEGDLKSQAGQHKAVVLAQSFLDAPLEGPQGKDWTVDCSHNVLLNLDTFNYQTILVRVAMAQLFSLTHHKRVDG
jgi:hypothetical protein